MNRHLLILVALFISLQAFAQRTSSSFPRSPSSANADTVSIALGDSLQIFHLHQPDAMGLFNVPDMHTAVLQEPDSSYYLWITGNISSNTSDRGSIARLRTKNFLSYTNAGPGSADSVSPVFRPSCQGDPGPVNCRMIYDADYVGANSVVRASNGKDLLMFYEAGNKGYGFNSTSPDGEFNVIALARSTDEGVTWTRLGPVISGPDTMAESYPGISQPGISEPGVVVANGYIYMFYNYCPNDTSEPESPSVIQVARAPLSGDGAPGTWTKFRNGLFGSDPGLRGQGSPIVATGGTTNCTRPVQVWPAFCKYLKQWVLFFLANEGWFFSTSSDLVTWSAPTKFLDMLMWRTCKPMDLNYILVTPGLPAGVIDRTGLVLYASTPSHGGGCPTMVPHELWVRPFTFSASPTGVSESTAAAPLAYRLAQNYPNPFNPNTIIKYELPKSSMVRLSVYDILGREMSVLVNERKDAGSYEVEFDAAGLASGVYFYRFTAGQFVQTLRMDVVK